MAPTLDFLPEELIEEIVRFIDDPASICALRATGRSISLKCSRGLFTTFFHRKRLELTEDAFRKALPVLSTFGGLVKELTVLIPYGNQAALDLAKERHEIESIQAQCFAALKSASDDDCLPTLILDISSDSHPEPSDERFYDDLDQRCYNIAETARTTLRALRACRDVPRMVDFGRCSIPMNAFEEDLASSDAPPILKSVHDLALSISHRHQIKDVQPETWIDDAEEYITTICRILEGATSLKSIDLHWYNLSSWAIRYKEDLMQKYLAERRSFDRCLASLIALPLRSCTLRGIYTTSRNLCDFLNATPAREIMLQSIYIYEGSWTEALDILTRSQDPFEEIRLDNLFRCHADDEDSTSVICFNGPDKPTWKSPSSNGWPMHLHRLGAEVPQALQWKHASPVPGSGVLGWRHGLRDQFGPPDKRV